MCLLVFGLHALTIFPWLLLAANFAFLSVLVNSLDNVCAEPKPSDARYLDGLHKTYARHQDFPRTQPKDIVSTRRRESKIHVRHLRADFSSS